MRGIAPYNLSMARHNKHISDTPIASKPMSLFQVVSSRLCGPSKILAEQDCSSATTTVRCGALAKQGLHLIFSATSSITTSSPTDPTRPISQIAHRSLPSATQSHPYSNLHECRRSTSPDPYRMTIMQQIVHQVLCPPPLVFCIGGSGAAGDLIDQFVFDELARAIFRNVHFVCSIVSEIGF